MPRKNSRRRRGTRTPAPGAGRRPAGPGRADALEAMLGIDTGYSHDLAGDGGWHVRQIPAWRAVKDYTCPGCGRTIRQGVAHLVAWRSDWIMGDEEAAADRRHWHPVCWRTRPTR
ncbi:hypothetical protein HDA30_000467 [Micrococcus cohnii]|uniref:ATP/GTP-binding protein n=1 Tax=Micrococcus cohnii TaxID=993416 RepID=A0A7W7M2L6_9MICC|nr:hypothetical protein [Micrococcus cohnii]MBB4734959.1 hypothetical protein [Micrococcus cohnii]